MHTAVRLFAYTICTNLHRHLHSKPSGELIRYNRTLPRSLRALAVLLYYCAVDGEGGLRRQAALAHVLEVARHADVALIPSVVRPGVLDFPILATVGVAPRRRVAGRDVRVDVADVAVLSPHLP